MAALEDEEYQLPSYGPTDPSPYDAVAVPQPQSALGTDEDYGGGEDTAPPSLSGLQIAAALATRTPAPAGTARAAMQQLVRERLAQRQAASTQAAPIGFGSFDANALAKTQFDPNAELQLDVPPQEKPQEEAGWGQIFSRGLLRANEAVAQGKDVAEGKAPRASKTPAAEFEQPIELGDFLSPATAAKKLWYGLAKSYPAVAASVAGTAVGTAAGTAVGGLPGGAIGGIVGGAAGMGSGSFLMEIGPAYQAEREAFGEGITPEQDQEAWDKAWNKSLIAGGVGAASMGLFGAGKPVSNALKSLLTPVVEGAAKPVAGIPLRAAVQTVGQPAISVGGQVTENVVEGKPLDTNLNQAVAGGIANVVPDVAAALGGRVTRRVLGGRPDKVTPGVTDEQKLALDAAAGETPPRTTPAGPGGTPLGPEPTPARPTPPPFEAPPAPPGTGPGGMPLGEGPAGPGGAGIVRPPGGGPGGTELPPEMPTPGGIPPRPLPVGPPGAGPGGTPLPEEPLPVRPTPVVPPEPPPPPPPPSGPSRIQERFGVTPPEPGMASVPIEAGPRSAIQEKYGTPGVGERTIQPPEEPPLPPPPEPPPPPPPPPVGPLGPSRLQERVGNVPPEPALALETLGVGPRSRIQERYGTEGVGERTATHVEPDDVNPGQFVAKGDDVVIGKGASPEEALADARARRGEPYAEEVPAKQARPTEAGTVELPPIPEEVLATARGERAPPAEAAKPEPAARGRDAASETPKKETLAEQVKAKGEAKKATSKAKAAEVKAKGEARTKPPQGERDVTQEVREGILSDKEDATRTQAFDDFTERTKRVLDEQKVSQTRRNNDMQRRQEAWEAGFDAGLRDRLTGPQWNAPNVVNSFREGREVGRSIRAERAVTKSTEGSLRKKPPTETVTKSAEELRTETRPETEEGTRTKSGAYVSPGEAAEAQASRPAHQRTEMQQEARDESAGHTRQSSHILAQKMAPESADPFHVPGNINTERTARRLIRHILNGMKVADAVERFGGKAEGTVGRPRNIESLSSFIRKELEAFDSSAAEAARDVEMARAAARLRKLGPEPIPGEVGPERLAILEEITERLDLTEQVRANRPKLEAALAQVEAIERGEVKAQSRVAPGSLDDYRRVASEQEARRNLLERVRVPDVNEPVNDIMRQFGSSKFHTLLDAIIGTPAAQKLTPQLVEIAKILKRRTENFEVRDTDLGRGVQGEHELGSGRIDLNMDEFARAGTSPVVTLLHEGLHGSTIRYIDYLFNMSEMHLTPQELAHKTALGAIAREVNDVLARHGSRYTEIERWQLAYAASESPTGGFHEIITKFFTEPEVTAIMSTTPPSAQLRSTLTQAGMSGRGVSSLWGAFKSIIRNIFGFSREHDSIMDLVMRPLTEIIDVGARFERAETIRLRQETVRQNNEVLGTRVSARDETSMRRLRETATRTVKDIADRGLIKTAMRGAFQSATTTAIRDFIKGDVPSAVSHLEHLRRITHASEQERVRPVTTHGPNGEERTEPNIDKARRLHQELKTGPDAAETNKLMTEVTQAEMSVIDPRRNAHLVTDAQLRQQEAFQARFDALDPRAKQTYREVNEYHNEIYRAEREAKVKNLVDIAFGDRPEAEKQAIREQMRTKEGVLDVLNNPDATPVSKVLGRDWDNKKDLVRLIAESQEGGFVDGDYFPSRRHGEYVVSAGEHNKPGYLVQMFETQSSAQTFRDQLIQSGRKDVSQVFVKSRSRPRDLVSVAALSTLDKAMERAGLSGDAAEVMRDMYAGVMIQHGTRLAERTMRREGIVGASVDQARNILGDFLAYTSRIGHLMHGADAARTLYASEKEARALHQAGSGASEQRVANAQLGVEELRNRMSPGDGDRSADLMGTGTRRLTTLTVLNTLLRPAHFFMQLAGTHAASTSLIAARHGYLSSVGAVNRAYAQLAGTAGGAAKTNAMAALRQELRAANWDLADMYRKRLSRANSGIAPDHADLLIDRLNQAGLINHTWIREIQRLAGPQGFGDSKFNFVSRFLDVSSAGEHAIDSMMRVGTAKAAFELEYRKNGGHLNDALDYAMQMAERSQPDYTMHNKARIATVQGSLGRLAPLTTQFRQFGLHMYGVQGNLLAEGVRGAKGSAERAEAFKSIAYLQASHALIWSGVGTAVFGSLPMMAGLGLYDLINPNDPTNRAHTNREAETASRNWVRNVTGSKTAADIFAHGIPMAFGLNVSRSLQFTNMLSPPELNSFNKPDVLSFLAQAMTGASSDTAAGLVEGISRFWGGDTSKENIAKLLPRILRDPLEAVVWGEQGLKTHKGDLTIVPPEKFSTADLIAKGLGFIPETSSTARDARAAINLRELTHRDVSGSIIDRLVKAAPDERKAVMAEITRYNASADPADRITGQQIQSRLREQARINAMPGQFGMRVPRREYGKIAEITAFSR